MNQATKDSPLPPLATAVSGTLNNFVGWLESYGETSWDHQSYFAGPVGRWAKNVYYRHPKLGICAVAPMIFSEAFLPSARRLFHERIRFPIADAHYAMGYTFLYEATRQPAHLDRAVHFLNELKRSRAPAFKEYCWGYPFDWVTRNGVMTMNTPMITSTPYMFEAFFGVQRLAPRPEWQEVLESIARHAFSDIKEFPLSATAASCGYSPNDPQGGVINAAAYRSGLLAHAGQALGVEAYRDAAIRNLNFVLDNQNPDGSWYYAVDGVRSFIDHFHTCFVMKALAKVHTLTGHARCLEALQRGADYYMKNLFDSDGMPKPFSQAPRMTVYKRELYDCAESINLCLLLRDRVPQLQRTLETVVAGITKDWVTPAGSFRARRLYLGWDDVPMHRWGQSQMFRALAFYLRESTRHN